MRFLARNGQGKAIIGDPRNDENRIISQLQLLFIRFYNKIYDDVAHSHPSYAPDEVYEEARRVTVWHYQWIILKEFLPLIEYPDIFSCFKFALFLYYSNIRFHFYY